MALDLSKLKAMELPSREIEIEICGEKQKITVSAMSDELALDFRDLRKDNPIYEATMRKHTLVKCAGLTEDEAEILSTKAGDVVADILNAVVDLTTEFEQAREKLVHEAKKKA